MRKMTLHETGPSKLDMQISENIGSLNGPHPLLEILQGGGGITLSKDDAERLSRILELFILGDL